MKTIPLLMTKPNVELILANKKTQTRRLNFRGGVGDYLWIRETCWIYGHWIGSADKLRQSGKPRQIFVEHTDRMVRFMPPLVEPLGSALGFHRRGGIHMPRWANRLTLFVRAVRQERLQAISKADVIAEGLTERNGFPLADCVAGWHEPYAQLWDSINGEGSWDINPEITVVTFDALNYNIDHVCVPAPQTQRTKP